MSVSNINSNLNILYNIKAPSQPEITVDDLLSRNKLPDGTNKRVPCAFIIYRMSLQRELKSKGYKLPLQQISAIAANAWKNESKEVKQAYINLVNNAKARYKEEFSQSQNNLVFENFNANFNNIPTNVNSAFDSYPLPESLQNTSYFGSSFNNFITIEGDDNLVPESDELKERIRILEGRLNLVADLLGFQFL
ncbi:hypothetical protein C1645_742072 [Glomus cerebriforme]|uniref:HMG box domain-containing protein n=1 Tax=Glomus cerebriforme TaxID=658196 RepID=A0A397SJI5_9GLOM|nr:hypothetical protein C1645_742072 [Glomus cerebriforme]